jgi:hypothetical protein
VATTTTLPRTSDGVLTLDELAVLMTTSPAHIKPEKDGETVIVTTKGAYLWAILFSEVADRDAEPESFLKTFREYLVEQGDVFRLVYGALGVDAQQETAHSLFNYMATSYALDVNALAERANAAYMSLIDKGLIEDPLKKKIAVFVLCVSGLIPTNVTSTTNKGGDTVQTYKSGWIDVEHHKGAKQESTKVDIKVISMVKKVYPKMMDILNDVFEDGSDKTKTRKK